MKRALFLLTLIQLMAAGQPTQEAALEAAWRLLPQRLQLEQQGQALAQKAYPWLHGIPELSFDYQGEDASGLQAEWEVGLDLPLALPGFQRLQRKLKTGFEGLQEQEKRFMRWQLAGHLQTLWWDFQLIKVKKHQSEVALLDSQQQKEWLRHLVDLGERTRDEGNQADQQWVLDQFQYQEAQQELAASEREWFQVTGMKGLPEQWDLEKEKDLPQNLNENLHPYLSWIKQQMELEELQLEHSKKLDGAPSFRMGMKKVESLQGVPTSNAWKVGVTFPLKNRTVGAYHDGHRSLGEAKSFYRQTKLALELLVDQLRAAMDSNQLQLDLLEPMVPEMETQFEMKKIAYRQNLISALEWQQIRQINRRFRQQYGQAVIRQGALESKYVHTLGVMP